MKCNIWHILNHNVCELFQSFTKPCTTSLNFNLTIIWHTLHPNDTTMNLVQEPSFRATLDTCPSGLCLSQTLELVSFLRLSVFTQNFFRKYFKYFTIVINCSEWQFLRKVKIKMKIKFLSAFTAL